MTGKMMSQPEMYIDMFDESCKEEKWRAWELNQTELKLKIADSRVQQLSALLRDQA